MSASTLANCLGHFFPGHDDPDNDTVTMASGACCALCRMQFWCANQELVVTKLEGEVDKLQARAWELEDKLGCSPSLLRRELP